MVLKDYDECDHEVNDGIWWWCWWLWWMRILTVNKINNNMVKDLYWCGGGECWCLSGGGYGDDCDDEGWWWLLWWILMMANYDEDE